MEIYILVKIVFILTITILLLTRKENNHVEYFSQQTWSTKEILPVYLVLIFLSFICFILYKNYNVGRLYIFASLIYTFLTGSILFFYAKRIMSRKGIFSFETIGAKSYDLYWLSILIAIQCSVLSVILYNKFSIEDYSHIFWLLVYFSVVLFFWPVIESVLYLGMLFIPTGRIMGLVKSAILISLLQALSHFHNNPSELLINFIIFGLLGCYLYIKSKRIIVPLMVHSSINFFILIRDLNSFLESSGISITK